MISASPGPRPTDAYRSDRHVSVVERIFYPEWGPIVAGSIAAAALALVLHAFALAIGLSVSSAAPTWRDASFALVLLSGLYVVLAALASYGLGGYLAGLMRARASSREDGDLRDGLHGLLAWALATLLTAVIGLATAQSLTRLAAPPGGQTGPSTSAMRLRTEAAVKVDWPKGLKQEVLCFRIPFRRIHQHSSLGRLDDPQETKMPIWTKFALSVAIVLGAAATCARAEGGA
jgi:hypothetical protein